MEGFGIALIASVTAILTASITYIATTRRDRLQATFEICRYKEKWLEQLRREIAELSSMSYAVGAGEIYTEKELTEKFAIISLLVGNDNPHWPELKEAMVKALDKLDMTGGRSANEIPNEFENTSIVIAGKKIINSEWKNIHNLLEGKNA